ncbi:hypothetical protein J9303_20660 [Bacillaceae bacterium Marseille-Q3522]|nr:hypothetical protein [Bacillaceae bacterium Marseille-Q3522]
MKSGGVLNSRDKLKTSNDKVRFLTLTLLGLRPRAARRRSWIKKSGGRLVKPIGCWRHLDRRRSLPSSQMVKQPYGLAPGAGSRKAEAAFTATKAKQKGRLPGFHSSSISII